MKNLIEYRYSCEKAMFDYLKSRNLDKLIDELVKVEKMATNSVGGENAKLRFKFGDDDTLATTIRNIDFALDLPSSHPNKKFMLDNFKFIVGVDPKAELRVFYS